jgi:hypothetical protein
MNCEDFNKIIDELADHKPMQATIRDASVSHVALCAVCAGKLANARAVGSCLLLAASAESEDAPVRIKENLLAAFADRHRAESLTPKVVDISSRRRSRGWWSAAAVAVAAVLLLAVIVPNWRKASAPDSPPPANQLLAGAHEPAATREVAGEIANKVANKTPLAADEGIQNETARPPVKTSPNRPRRLRNRIPESVTTPEAHESVAQNAGEYVPLTYLATATAMDSGTIVRVELSRSALTSLGFPVNVEGSSQSVKADVILGDDGVARAIRLVQ